MEKIGLFFHCTLRFNTLILWEKDDRVSHEGGLGRPNEINRRSGHPGLSCPLAIPWMEIA
jgi:hypothetical protein